MKVGLIGAAAIATVAGLAPLASASLLAYDGFDTSNSNGTALASATDNDGTGWNGQWTVGGSGGTLTTGLSYSESSPVSATYFSSGQAVIYNANSSNTNFRSLATASQVTAASGNTLWVSFLMNSSAETHAQLSLISGGNIITDLGTDETADYGVDNGVAGGYAWTNDTSAAVSYGSTALIVGELTFSSSTTATINFWVDPDFTAANPGAPQISVALSQASGVQIGQIRLFESGGSSGGSTATFDEIRIGNSYTDVVPEPMTFGLLTGAAVILAMRRRRSAF